ncbi:MAG: hypothetical protein O2999_10705 [Nitrospirae bacterium]|nr:hypothetical protein [Nitrospirota bacterium]MDA1304753.1 hypothetical protein [Nitrospirota bacterium]
MRKPNDIIIDRTLLIYVLHLSESKEFSMVSDVKLQHLVFLAELQMLGKGLRGFHYDFMRYPYGVISRDLDNDLLAMRKKEQLQNFDIVGRSEKCIPLLEGAITGVEVHEQIMEIIQSVIVTYGAQDLGEIAKSVEDVEISAVDTPEEKILILDIPFHAMMLVPSRIEVTGELILPPKTLSQLTKVLSL